MTVGSEKELRRGWTTGACATAAVKAALLRLWGGAFPEHVAITLPRGETPDWTLAHQDNGDGWAEAGVIKDAGDDPDVTHGCMVVVRVVPGIAGRGVTFHAGEGVGTVTKPGLPISPGEPAINPKPREMMQGIVAELASEFGRAADIEITISIPGGAELAKKTWNPRLGIAGGLSVLGTTGVVRPFSCSAWIASIHRGVDVARATGIMHLAGCTGATSEATTRAHYSLEESSVIDMGDFAGGMLKYIRAHPVSRVTIGGGPGKLAKLGQGAADLHSGRSQVDMTVLNQRALAAGLCNISGSNTVLEALTRAGPGLARIIAETALSAMQDRLGDPDIVADILVIGRDGKIIAEAHSK